MSRMLTGLDLNSPLFWRQMIVEKDSSIGNVLIECRKPWLAVDDERFGGTCANGGYAEETVDAVRKGLLLLRDARKELRLTRL